jgi:AcrR family transcriptional regulator
VGYRLNVTDAPVHFCKVRVVTAQMPQLLRSDARDNRDRVLAAARELFAERGLDVTMRDIARRAGVGPATLYRRFPTKRDIVEAAFHEEVRTCRQIVEDGCDDPDPWRGFCSVIDKISVLNVGNQGFVTAFTGTPSDTDILAAHRTSVLKDLSALTRRAKVAGTLRSDFVINDLVLVLLAGRGLASLPPAERQSAARRFATLAIDAFRA